jgi:hypothetical protein
MTNGTKITTLAPGRKAQKSLVERAMAGLDEVMAVKQELSVVDEAMKKFWRSESIVSQFDVLQVPDVGVVRARVASLREALFGETNVLAARAMFGLMLDAIPAAQKFESATYLDALVSTVLAEQDLNRAQLIAEYGSSVSGSGGFPPVVIAAAVRRIWRSATFTPTISDVLKELHAARGQLQSIIKQAEMFLAERERFGTLAMQDRVRSEREREAIARERDEREAEEERRYQREHIAEVERRAAERRATAENQRA